MSRSIRLKFIHTTRNEGIGTLNVFVVTVVKFWKILAGKLVTILVSVSVAVLPYLRWLYRRLSLYPRLI